MPNPSGLPRGILIAGAITAGALLTVMGLALSGMFERLGAGVSVGIVMADFATVALVWFLALSGRLDGPR